MVKLLILLFFIGGIVIGGYLLSQNQIFKSKASEDHPVLSSINIFNQNLNPYDQFQTATVDLTKENPVRVTITYADGRPSRNFLFNFTRNNNNSGCAGDDCPAPSSVQASCDGKNLKISWDQVTGAQKYAIRVNNTKDGFTCASNASGDRCQELTETSFSLNNAPEGDYDIWVHTIGNDNHYSSDARHSQVVSCRQDTTSCSFGLCKPDLTLNSSNGQISAQWTSVNGAAFYALRLSTNNRNPDTDQNDRYSSTSYSHSCQSGRTYYFWVHPMKGDGQYGEAIQSSVVCQGATSSTGGSSQCVWQDRNPECDWNNHRARAVQQNSCTGEYRYPFYQFQPGNCGFSPGSSEGSMCTYGEQYSGGTRSCLGTIQQGTCKWNGGGPQDICDKW